MSKHNSDVLLAMISRNREILSKLEVVSAELSVSRHELNIATKTISAQKYHIEKLVSRIDELQNMARTVNAERDLEVVKDYEAGETLRTIGDKFGITRERVRQIATDSGCAPRRMRKTVTSEPI